MLSMVGGILGLAAGYVGIHVLLRLSPGIPRIGPIGSHIVFDWRVFAFTFALSILTGVLFGLVPALDSSRADLSSTLRAIGKHGGTGSRHNKARALLITTEMALAVVLLIGAALMIRSFIAIRKVNPGFDAHHVLTMRMLLTGPRFNDPAHAARVIHDGVRRIRELPGVDVAATGCCVPLDSRLQVAFQMTGRPDNWDSPE